MALDQSALIDLLEALKSTDVDERVRTATEHLYQALIDAELTAVIGAAPHRHPHRPAQRQPPADAEYDLAGSGAADPEATGRGGPLVGRDALRT